jgi:hypothetical protein
MKTFVKSKPASVAAALGMLAACGSAMAQYSYDNSTGDLGLFIDPTDPAPGYSIIADQVHLVPGSANANSISVALSGLGVSGDESLTLTLFALDGPAVIGSPNSPLTVLDTVGGPLGWGPGDHNSQWFTYDLGGLAVPPVIAVGYSFGGVDPNETVGPHLYDPPTIGAALPGGPYPPTVGSYGDHWRFNGAWELAVLGFTPPPLSIPDPAANYGIRIAVPEASTVWGLTGLGALIGLTLYRRFRR